MIFLGLTLAMGMLIIRRSIRHPELISVLSRYDTSAPILGRYGRIVDNTSGRFAVSSTDIAIVNSSVTRITTERLITAMVMAAIPLLMLVITALGGHSLPLSAMLLGSIGGAVAGFMLPIIQLRSRAATKRREFRSSLSAYLDLVSIMLAGGAGIETALVAASRVGDGSTFGAIADALDAARTTRRSPWDVLAECGERIGIEELPELAATVRLGGEQGARMTASLIAKASSMRDKQLAEIEAQANSATERMGLPMVLLFMGFLVLLGYPAMQMINAGFSV